MCPSGHEVERQRQAPVALAGDAPVAHVAQPVLHALAEVAASTRRGVGVDHRLADLVAADEPLVDDAEDQLRPAAPAVRVAVLVRLPAGEPAAVLEVLGDEVGHLVRAVAGEPAVTVDEQPRLVDRHEHRQLLARPSSKSSSPQPGAMWTMPVPSSHRRSSDGDHAVRDLGLRGQVVERRSRTGARPAPRPRTRPTMRASGPKTAAQRSSATTCRSPPTSTQT